MHDEKNIDVRVVVHAFGDVNTWGRVNVSGEQGVDVVGTTVSGFDHQRQVWWQTTVVSGTGSLVVGVWGGHVVGKLSSGMLALHFSFPSDVRPLEHLSLVVGSIGVFNLLGHGLGLVDSVRHTDQVTPSDSVERVTCGTNFSVDCC